jgi:hypothetical protein
MTSVYQSCGKAKDPERKPEKYRHQNTHNAPFAFARTTFFSLHPTPESIFVYIYQHRIQLSSSFCSLILP